MSLSTAAPARIGPYQVLEKLGQGGMGLVYKARDTRLNRLVALKVLPADSLGDAACRSRFMLEAKAASALNHPNIVTIHDVGEEGETLFIVMEYVKGKTLGQVIPRGGMGLQDLLRTAVQLAEGLARAHGLGIVHRDLKPANIIVTPDGTVKILDFGLAKMKELPGGGPEDETRTATNPKTQEGTILGTVGYMSPEQVDGKPVDNRSDIFSLGAVLYEMATGQRAFRADSNASTLAAILKEEPRPIAGLTPGVPPELEKIISRCLRKDPDRRFQHAADLKVALEDLKEESNSSRLTPPLLATKQRRWWAWAILGLALLSSGLAFTTWLSRRDRELTQSAGILVQVTAFPSFELGPGISPDGKQVAFAWYGEKGDNLDVYVKMLDSPGMLRLTTGPDIEVDPAWSSDGRWIAFYRATRTLDEVSLVVVPAIGGSERVLWEESGPPDVNSSFGSRHLSWSPDSRWIVGDYFAGPGQPLQLALFSLSTNEVRPIPNSALGGGIAGSGAISPDGRTLLFAHYTGLISSRICVVPLLPDFRIGAPVRTLVDRGSPENPVWMPDGRGVLYNSWKGGLWITSESGETPRQLKEAGESSFCPSISSDGKRIVFQQSSWDTNIYRAGLTGTEPPALFLSSTRTDAGPLYSPDSRRIVFFSRRSGEPGVWVAEADGSNATQIFFKAGGSFGWSPDSRRIVFSSNAEGSADIYTISLHGGQAQRLMPDLSDETHPCWSHDGRWIYFRSTKSGRSEIWRMPSGGGEWVQLTRSGAMWPQASPDGRWIYFLRGESNHETIWRMPVKTGKEEKVLEDVVGSAFVTYNDGIYFLRIINEEPGTAEFGVNYLDLGKKVTKTLVKVTGVPYAGSFTVTPDRKTVAFTRIDSEGSDLMMLDDLTQ